MRSGTVELRSGRWQWSIEDATRKEEPRTGGLRQTAMSDGEPEPEADEPPARLVLEAPDDPRIRMARDVPVSTDPGDEPEVRDLARDAEVRTVIDDEGEMWRFTRVARPDSARDTDDFERPPPSVRYAPRDEPERVGHLPPDRTLGDATRDELLAIVRSDREDTPA